jgi:hypothetical protein
MTKYWSLRHSGVDRDERFGNLDDPHIIRHDRAHAHGEVDVVDSRHVAAAVDILTDLASLFSRQVHRALLALALLDLALTLVSALLALVLCVALLSLTLLGLALTLVSALLASVLRIALLSLILLGLALTLVPTLLALVLRIALLSLTLLGFARTVVLKLLVPCTASLALLGLALTLVPALFALVLRITLRLALTFPVSLRRLTGRAIPRRLVFLRLFRLSSAFRLSIVRRLS